jgi:isopentenyl diphosphate isomerase/L-lactate dehydrogenase-like FMN-dependent dehydrogenase
MLGHDDACKNIFRHRQVVADRGANWDFLARLRERWPRRLVVKGVLNPEDAQRLQALGVDAVQVPNHGARQLDAALSPLEALPAIRTAVGPDFPLILDGGVRQGEDVGKALACGADFVMLGRPFLYAAAARGLPGVNALVDTLADDIRIALAQLGLASVGEVGAQVLATPLPHSDASKPRRTPGLTA